MAKIWTYVTVMVGLTFLLKIAGIPTGLDWLLDFFGGGTSAVNSSGFYIAIIAGLGIVTTATIVIGAFGRTAPEYAIKAPFAIANLALLISTFVSISSYMSNFSTWLFYPISSIMLVYSVGFVFALYTWVFEGDS